MMKKLTCLLRGIALLSGVGKWRREVASGSGVGNRISIAFRILTTIHGHSLAQEDTHYPLGVLTFQYMPNRLRNLYIGLMA